MPGGSRSAFVGALLAALIAVSPAMAQGAAPSADVPAPPVVTDDMPVVVWPTLTGDDVSGVAIHKPGPGEGTIHARALELDATLRDAVQDLGFTLDVGDPGPSMGHARDLDMLERAQHSSTRANTKEDAGTWVVSARLEPASGDAFVLRIVAVAPKSKQLRMRVERVPAADVPVRGLVFLRDLLSSASTSGGGDTGPLPEQSSGSGIMAPMRSPGRAVLATNAALFGGFMAFSVQRASGSDDPRLLYPLLTLGTGLGLGTALLVAEEWNVSTGDAWTLAGGAWWGAAAGILIANGRHVQPLADRYAWGVGGGLAGLGLATFSLTRHKADEGDAFLVHSGAGLGLGLGALADWFYRGDLEKTPYTGTGYGSAVGLAIGGTLATFAHVSPSRVLLVDLGAGLGAAAGAAIGSPLVFENVTPEKTRGFVASTFAGTLVGGAAAWWFTRDRKLPTPSRAVHFVPYGGAMGQGGYGAGVRGTF